MATILPRPTENADRIVDVTDLDATLVRDLRAGRHDAFEHLYEAYRTRIYNLALRIVRSREDARDITQEVFIKAYRQLPQGDTELRIKPWLYRVAVNACYDHLRARKMHSDIDEIEAPARAVHIDTFEQAELSQQLEQTLSDLSDRHRTVLLLKDIHGLRHDEIASILGVSRGATETLLFRAREAFRQKYAELTRDRPVVTCELARQATVAAVGGTLPDSERRKIMDHARHCPTCGETVKSWGIAAVSLGLFIHTVPLPAALQTPLLTGAAASAGAGGGVGSGAVGAGAAGTAGAGAGSAGASTVAGGLVAKIGGAAVAKIVAVAVAATCAATASGVAAHEISVAHHRSADRPAAAATAHPGNSAGSSKSGASKGKAVGKTKKKSAKSNNGKAVGKTKDKAAKSNNGKAKDKSTKSNNGKAVGKTKDKAAKSNNGKAKDKSTKSDSAGGVSDTR